MFEKIKKVLTPAEIDEQANRRIPNREERRQKYSRRRRQFRRTVSGKVDYWEWKYTQDHPAKRRDRNRRRNKAARASRKAHR